MLKGKTELTQSTENLLWPIGHHKREETELFSCGFSSSKNMWYVSDHLDLQEKNTYKCDVPPNHPAPPHPGD